jgi:5'-nucleotidase
VLPGFIKAGAPAFGQDPIDPNIFYYNGTPATMVFLALDYVLPKYANLSTVDLVLSGPNFGLNLGPFLYTIVSILQAKTHPKLKA